MPFVLTTLIACALLSLGAVKPMPFNLLTLAVGIAFVGSMIASRRGATNRQISYTAEFRKATPLTIITLLPVIQLCLHSINPGESDRYATLTAGRLLVALLLFYMMASAATREPGMFRVMFFSLLAVMFAEGLYGLLNLLSGNERLLFYERSPIPTYATGTLTNRNHFAYLMEMSLPLALVSGLMFVPLQRDTRRSTDSETTAWHILAVTATVVLGLALVFSQSRMGIFSLLAAGVTIGVASALLRPRSRPRRMVRTHRWALPAVFTLTLLSFSLVIGIGPVLERFFDIPQDLEQGRMPAWQPALAMWRDAPMLGHGWDNYKSLWPAYANHPTGLYYRHAHNEYLQLLAETGLAGAAIVAYPLFLFARRTVGALSRPLSHAQRSVTIALAAGITSIVFHSTTDFGLRIPGVSFTFILIVALFVRITEDPSLIDGRDAQA